jgi:hypothetical protein
MAPLAAAAGKDNSPNRSSCRMEITLRTLQQAVAYLGKTIPKAERDMPEVLTAAEMLTRAAEDDGWPVEFARIATLQAIHRHAKRVFNPDRKDTHWGKRKLKRDE